MPRWFRKKRAGYGWTPCAWQGWAIPAAFMAAILALALEAKSLGQAKFLGITAVLMVALFVVTAFTSGSDSDS